MLRTLNEEFGKTIVMVTHDPRAAHSPARRHLDKAVLRPAGLIQPPDVTPMISVRLILRNGLRNKVRSDLHRHIVALGLFPLSCCWAS